MALCQSNARVFKKAASVECRLLPLDVRDSTRAQGGPRGSCLQPLPRLPSQVPGRTHRAHQGYRLPYIYRSKGLPPTRSSPYLVFGEPVTVFTRISFYWLMRRPAASAQGCTCSVSLSPGGHVSFSRFQRGLEPHSSILLRV